MTTLAVNVSDKTEKRFRKVAATVMSKNKGFLGRAIAWQCLNGQIKN